MLFFPIGGSLARRYKPRNLILSIAPVGLIGIFVSSFMEDYWVWLGVYGTSFGFSIGCLYILPMQVAWKHFPNRIGLAGGIAASGFGFGSFFFNFISTAIANPKNLKAKDSIYPKEVGDNVPVMIQSLAGIWTVLVIIAALLINEKKETKEEKSEADNPKKLNSSLNEYPEAESLFQMLATR